MFKKQRTTRRCGINEKWILDEKEIWEKNTKCAKREPFMVTMDIIQNEDRVQYSANTYQFPQPFRNKKMHETFNASYY